METCDPERFESVDVNQANQKNKNKFTPFKWQLLLLAVSELSRKKGCTNAQNKHGACFFFIFYKVIES